MLVQMPGKFLDGQQLKLQRQELIMQPLAFQQVPQF